MHLTTAEMEPATKRETRLKKVEDIDFSNQPYGKVGTTRTHHKS